MNILITIFLALASPLLITSFMYIPIVRRQARYSRQFRIMMCVLLAVITFFTTLFSFAYSYSRILSIGINHPPDPFSIEQIKHELLLETISPGFMYPEDQACIILEGAECEYVSNFKRPESPIPFVLLHISLSMGGLAALRVFEITRVDRKLKIKE